MLKRLLPIGVAVAALAVAAPGFTQTCENFGSTGSPAAGTVAAGTLPQGGSASGMLFTGFTLSVTNNNGPQSLIIFDSANPTGNDPDLGSPNQTCAGGGPGVGTGGEVGMPGENCVPQGNLLVIANDIVDTNTDNIVDDPDDDASGGVIKFTFDAVVQVLSIDVMDIDSETASFTLENNGTLKGTVNATDLGNNSVQTLDLSSFGDITCLEIEFSSSGALSQICWQESATPVEEMSWSKIKKEGHELLPKK